MKYTPKKSKWKAKPTNSHTHTDKHAHTRLRT